MPKDTSRASAEVRALFNAKAPTWNEKYRADGPLAFRVAAFQKLILGRCSADAKVLDLGCGTGAIATALFDAGFRVTGCDIAEEMIEAGKRAHAEADIEWRALPSDWEQLPFDAGCFDAIVASSVLEYLPNLETVLAECQRSLRPGGILIATVPDPRTLTRKLEGLARPGAILINEFVGLRWLPKLQSYATYLKCSRNRMPQEQWRAIGMRARFAAVDRINTDDSNVSLMFLIFSKATIEAGQ